MDHVVAVGVLAHNEEATIATILGDLAKQDLLARSDLRVEVHVVANGCCDATPVQAWDCAPAFDAAGADRFVVHELERADKATSWNHLVHGAACGADALVFVDADIRIDDETALSQLVDTLHGEPDVAVATTHPTKRFDGSWTSPTARLLRRLAPEGSDASAICGQLYAGRGTVLRGICLPEGLPAEDGFLRAMILTDSFRRAEQHRAVRRTPARHYFDPERSIRGVLDHQTRLVVGGSVNASLYDLFRQIRARPGGSGVDLASYVRLRNGTGWLDQVAGSAPTVPVHYLVRRAAGAGRDGWRRAVTRAPALLAGTALDAVAWARATRVVRDGRAVGYW